MKKPKKIGIALEGGGVKGAYEVGVLKAIQELDIKYGCVTGTSIGAVNAVAYVLGEFEKYRSLWGKMNFSIGDNKNESRNVQRFNFKEIKNNIEKFEKEYINSEGINPEEIKKMFKEYINEEAIRKSEIKLGLTTYCLTDKKFLNLFIEDIPEGMLSEYIFASCNLPVFTPTLINGKYYIDGGIFNSLPINMLVENGFETIITVRLRAAPYDFSPYKNIKIIDIAPDMYLSNTLYANQERVKWMIDKGYEDSKKILNKNLSYIK